MEILKSKLSFCSCDLLNYCLLAIRLEKKKKENKKLTKIYQILLRSIVNFLLDEIYASKGRNFEMKYKLQIFHSIKIKIQLEITSRLR